MADVADEIIDAIHVELNVISGSTIAYVKGKLEGDQHSAPPRIVWLDVSGLIEPSKMGGTIGTDVARFAVEIWQTDREQARNTLHNLVRAMRNAVYGPNLASPIAYEWVDDAHLNQGRKLIAQIAFEIPVSKVAPPSAVIASQDHTVTVGGVPVC